jgi:threonine aldolase
MDGAKIWYASKTVLFGLATAVAPSVLQYLGGVDWTQFGLSPVMGAVLGAVIVGLRSTTSSPITTSKQQ